MARILKNSLTFVLFFCIIGFLNLRSMEKSHTPSAASTLATAAQPPTLSLLSAPVPSAASHPSITIPSVAGIEIDSNALAPLLANIGANAGANAHLTVNVDPAVVKQLKEGLKDLGEAGLTKVSEAIAKGNFTVNVPVTHDFQISAGSAATVIGAVILAKSLYDGFWGTQTPTTDQNLLKEASRNASIDTELDKARYTKILEFVREHKNIIGGIVGLLLMCNQPILKLFGSKS